MELMRKTRILDNYPGVVVVEGNAMDIAELCDAGLSTPDAMVAFAHLCGRCAETGAPLFESTEAARMAPFRAVKEIAMAAMEVCGIVDEDGNQANDGSAAKN